MINKLWQELEENYPDKSVLSYRESMFLVRYGTVGHVELVCKLAGQTCA